MLFKRRDKLPIYRQITQWLWPQRGFQRAGRYVWYRIVRLPDTPHRIAAGLACGAAISFTPFLGLHILLGWLVAIVVRGNLFATVIGTFIGTPWTFPLFFALTSEVGSLFYVNEAITALPVWSWSEFFNGPISYLLERWPLMITMVIGSIPVAIMVWALFYIAFKGLIVGYKSRKTGRRGKVIDVGPNMNSSLPS